MEAHEAVEVERWRTLDREVQGVTDLVRRGAQAVVDVAEDSRRDAAAHGCDPLDDLVDRYLSAPGDETRTVILRALAYLRADAVLDPRRAESA